MRRKAVTIREVAQRAQVSVSTVSQILNGNPHYVGADKRERVLQAVAELQYRPNVIARSMVKQRTGTIGMIFTSVQDNQFIRIIESVQATLNPEGYMIFLANTPDIASEMQAIEAFQARQVDGFIFMSMSTTSVSESSHLVSLKEAGIPLVVINRHIDSNCDINQIHLNDREAGYLATKHLLKLGHHSIAMIGGPGSGDTPFFHSAVERREGWEQALAEEGISPSPNWFFNGCYTLEGGYAAMKQLLKQFGSKSALPTALFIASEAMTMGALRALNHAGVSIPRELALISIGDPVYAPYLTPALTTLVHPLPEAGRIAAQRLLEEIASREPLPTLHLALSFELRVRESCGSNPEPPQLLFQ
jgi:LacI family transcriptional regulator